MTETRKPPDQAAELARLKAEVAALRKDNDRLKPDDAALRRQLDEAYAAYNKVRPMRGPRMPPPLRNVEDFAKKKVFAPMEKCLRANIHEPVTPYRVEKGYLIGNNLDQLLAPKVAAYLPEEIKSRLRQLLDLVGGWKRRIPGPPEPKLIMPAMPRRIEAEHEVSEP